MHGAEGHSQVIDAEVDQLLDYRDLVEMDLVQGHCGGVVLAWLLSQLTEVVEYVLDLEDEVVENSLASSGDHLILISVLNLEAIRVHHNLQQYIIHDPNVSQYHILVLLAELDSPQKRHLLLEVNLLQRLMHQPPWAILRLIHNIKVLPNQTP